MHGSRFCRAISCARRCFFTVMGRYVPPFTVASFATIMHSRPCTRPTPVTLPAACTAPDTCGAAGAWPAACVVKHPVRGERRELEEGRVGTEQRRDPLAHR